ncbi:MAG TPA: metallophosphoesterase family protein [Anaerolinea sp.]|nr:metallophosphoesterase family protein [Anaerolinea sp.]
MGEERPFTALTIGVVADTHVPDRVNALHPALLDGLRAARVERIFHLGDVCVNRVLDELGQVAPVSVVRGNRDWLLKPPPPWTQPLTLNGVKLLLAHGQGDFFTYWFDKVLYVLVGYRFERYRRRLLHSSPDSQVFLFGHTHYPVNRIVDGRLYFNPGSASASFKSGKYLPSYGVLRFDFTGLGQSGGVCCASMKGAGWLGKSARCRAGGCGMGGGNQPDLHGDIFGSIPYI